MPVSRLAVSSRSSSRSMVVRMTDLIVMRPHPNHFHDALAAEDLIDEAMVDVDSPREGSVEIAEELLEGRRRLEGIGAEDFEQGFGFRLQSGAAEFLCVFRSLRRKDDPPAAHQS